MNSAKYAVLKKLSTQPIKNIIYIHILPNFIIVFLSVIIIVIVFIIFCLDRPRVYSTISDGVMHL